MSKKYPEVGNTDNLLPFLISEGNTSFAKSVGVFGCNSSKTSGSMM
jgi:hypothetical protein